MLKYILIFIFMFSVSIFSAPEMEMEEIPTLGCKIVKIDKIKKTATVLLENNSKTIEISIPETKEIKFYGKNGWKNLSFTELKVNNSLAISSKELHKDIKANKVDTTKIYDLIYIEAYK